MSKVIDILVNGNSDIVNKSPVIVLTKVNIKIKMDQAKFLLKSSCTKWISFKSWFQTLEIGQNYMGFVCWRLLQKFQNEKPDYYLPISLTREPIIYLEIYVMYYTCMYVKKRSFFIWRMLAIISQSLIHHRSQGYERCKPLFLLLFLLSAFRNEASLNYEQMLEIYLGLDSYTFT